MTNEFFMQVLRHYAQKRIPYQEAKKRIERDYKIKLPENKRLENSYQFAVSLIEERKNRYVNI